MIAQTVLFYYLTCYNLSSQTAQSSQAVHSYEEGIKVQEKTMTTPKIRLWHSLLLSGLLMGATGSRATGGTLVTVGFSGVGTGASAGQNFSGSFTYDQSLRVSGTPGRFIFTQSALTHTLTYKLGSNPQVAGSGPGCEPYIITTSGNGGTTFQLNASTPGNTIVIALPIGSTLSQRVLPLANAFPNPSALANSNFTVTGSTPFTGTIQTLNPQVAQPAPQAPAPCYVYVYSCPAPPACPVFACQPVSANCLSALFGRCFHRRSCW
jgi:hypothetical protein